MNKIAKPKQIIDLKNGLLKEGDFIVGRVDTDGNGGVDTSDPAAFALFIVNDGPATFPGRMAVMQYSLGSRSLLFHWLKVHLFSIVFNLFVFPIICSNARSC